VGAFAESDRVVLCIELANKLQSVLQNQQKTTDVLIFTIFHEIGHILLFQWHYPFYDNEEIADDFATALMLMFHQKERLNAATEFFISNPSSRELMATAIRNNRHPLSIQRARNIVNWSNDPARLSRWQLLLIPRMQTSTLQTLLAKVKSEQFKRAIQQELTLRN